VTAFTVYGIRRRYHCEVRYIGFTRAELETRLHQHTIDTTYGKDGRPLQHWIRANLGRVEIFAIRICATEAEARLMEKAAIATAALTGNRLFNCDHVPRQCRAQAAA
jgi:hypothetical protein